MCLCNDINEVVIAAINGSRLWMSDQFSVQESCENNFWCQSCNSPGQDEETGKMLKVHFCMAPKYNAVAGLNTERTILMKISSKDFESRLGRPQNKDIVQTIIVCGNIL